MTKRVAISLPKELRENWDGVPRKMMVLGTEYHYLVVAGDLKPAPKYFASCRPDRLLPPFISKEVPLTYRPFMMAHEIYEGYYLSGQPHRCLRALDFELGHVPVRHMIRYLSFRNEVLTELRRFMLSQAHADGYTEEQVTLVQEAQAYLQRLLT